MHSNDKSSDSQNQAPTADHALPFEEVSTPVAERFLAKQQRYIRIGFAFIALVFLSLWFGGYGGDESTKQPENNTSPTVVENQSAKPETHSAPVVPQSAQELTLSRDQIERLKALSRESLDEQAQSRAARLSANSDVLSDNASSAKNTAEAEGYPTEIQKEEDAPQHESSPAKIAVAHASRVLHLSTTVLQGTLLKATLETQIHSDLPGMVRAITGEDVYGQDNSQCLIPRGTRLVGNYVNHMMQGQNRIFIVWQRLIRPDGVTVALTSPGTDPLGGAGVAADEIDRHFWRQWGVASLLSVMSVGAGSGLHRSHENMPPADAYRQALSESFRDSAQRTFETQGNIQPTLTIYHGTPISVFIARDLDFYAALGA